MVGDGPGVSTDFTALPDLAARRFGGGVVWANDETFAARENLVIDAEPSFSAQTFGHRGQVYDGWETRRRREPGHDRAMVRLGVPGLVRGVVVDTAFFTGNYPPEVSVEATAVDGYPSPEELLAADWFPLVPRSPARGDHRNSYVVDRQERVTHVRLCQYPDGGVARLRVHGEPVPDPRFFGAGALDLAALEGGGRVVGCSNGFYSAPTNLIAPGKARTMGEGWETARRRDAGNDWVEFALAGHGCVRLVELDTSHFVGNAPGWAQVTGYDATAGDGRAGAVELLATQRLQPDTRHLFRVSRVENVTHARLDVYPDGGLARVRLWGELSKDGHDAAVVRWYNALPEHQLRAMAGAAGMTAAAVTELVAGRPVRCGADVPGAILE